MRARASWGLAAWRRRAAALFWKPLSWSTVTIRLRSAARVLRAMAGPHPAGVFTQRLVPHMM